MFMLRNAKMKLHSLTTLRPAKNLPEDKQTITTTKKKTKPKDPTKKKKGKLEGWDIRKEHFIRLNQDNFCEITFNFSIKVEVARTTTGI